VKLDAGRGLRHPVRRVGQKKQIIGKRIKTSGGRGQIPDKPCLTDSKRGEGRQRFEPADFNSKKNEVWDLPALSFRCLNALRRSSPKISVFPRCLPRLSLANWVGKVARPIGYEVLWKWRSQSRCRWQRAKDAAVIHASIRISVSTIETPDTIRDLHAGT